MGAQEHWEKVYATKAPAEVSWFRPHLETSLALIERAANKLSASIIDVGGGASSLVDDLIERGYRNIQFSISRTRPSISQGNAWDKFLNRSDGCKRT